MTHQLRALATLPEDQGSIPGIHNSSSRGSNTVSLDMHWYTYIYTGTTNTYTHKSKKSLIKLPVSPCPT